MSDDSAERYSIDDVAVIGRTFEEYCAMFDLDPGDLAGERVLDCPSGACSFVAEASDRGASAVGADVAYDGSAATLRERCAADVDRAMAALDGVEHLYRWTHYDDVADLRSYRERASERFLADYEANPGRYVAAELPSLPFRDDRFSLVLSAHFLFLYDDRLDDGFHRAALRELLRVADGELRVFPLVGFDAEPYDGLPAIVDDLRDDGYDAERRSVPFEFQKGATEMLVVEA